MAHFLIMVMRRMEKKIKVMVYGKIKIDSRNPEVTVSRLLIHKRLYEHTCSVDQGLKRILFHL